MPTSAVVVRGPGTRYAGKQGPTYASAVSAETTGSERLWFGRIEMAGGARTKAHLHEHHETAIYVVAGEADMYSGPRLEIHEIVRAGDTIYIPASVPHVAINRNATEPLIALASRTDPNEQESVVLLPDLDGLLHA